MNATHPPIHPNGAYTAAQVADILFQKSRAWFYAHRTTLHALDGFPQPISPRGQPRWAGTALIAWMQRPRGAVQPPATQGGTVTDLLAYRIAQMASPSTSRKGGRS